MRISTTQMTSSGVRQLLLRQAELQHTQLQISTQKRVINPSDDPVAATSINALQTEISQLQQFNRNADAASASNTLEEEVLGTTTDILFRVRSLMVEMGNGTYGEAELNAIGVEVEQRLTELVGLANTKNANNDYLFSGSQVKVKPFTQDAAGNYEYNGDQGQRMLRASSGLVVPVSDPGFDVFVNVKNGNGVFVTGANAANLGNGIISPGSYQGPPAFLDEPYTITFGVDGTGNTTYTVVGDDTGTTVVPATIWEEGDEITFSGVTTEIAGTPDGTAGDSFTVQPSSSQDVFTTIQNVLTAIENYSSTDSGSALFFNSLNAAQESLNRNMENIDIVRGKIGSRLNAIDSEVSSNLSLTVTAQAALSDVQDLDMVEASTRYSQQLVVLEAAQASFVRVRDLNLFNFL